jgi:hypothetical protein
METQRTTVVLFLIAAAVRTQYSSLSAYPLPSSRLRILMKQAVSGYRRVFQRIIVSTEMMEGQREEGMDLLEGMLREWHDSAPCGSNE